jgi:folylpolyglutamate synthase/dihydropteroate synthase
MPSAADFQNLAAITAWLDQALNHERSGTFRDIRLERLQSALAHLPKPPAPVTVGGTKGKGSTVRLLEAILLAHGKPVLAFTSPHVASIGERWRIDGIPATAQDLAESVAQVANLETNHHLSLTWFERTFCVAVLLAAQRPHTIFLCEVGLGGRLDCANALDADIAIITHLSHDHRDVLGPTLTHIAREKLAIARSRKALLIAPQSPEAAAAIRTVLAESFNPRQFPPYDPPPATGASLLRTSKTPRGNHDLIIEQMLQCADVDPTNLDVHQHLLSAVYARAGFMAATPGTAREPVRTLNPHRRFLVALRRFAAEPDPLHLLAIDDAARLLTAHVPAMADVALLYHEHYRDLVARSALHSGLDPTWITLPANPIPLALPGAHQQANAATALAAAHLLIPDLDVARARTAMAEAHLAARCQLIVWENSGRIRNILVDGAHNGPSIAATLAVAAATLRPGWRLILGTATDKEIAEILAIIPASIRVDRCAYHSPRARKKSDWPPAAQVWPWHDDITHALAGDDSADLCITGSFYLAGEALAALGQSGTIPG